MAAPLVRCPDLAMFDGHPLALTGWLDADQAELTVLYRPEDEGALEGHRLPLLRVAEFPVNNWRSGRMFVYIGLWPR